MSLGSSLVAGRARSLQCPRETQGRRATDLRAALGVWPSIRANRKADMAIEDVFEGNLGTGIVAAVGAAVLVPVLAPILRTVAKTVIKAGIVVYDRGQVMYHELAESSSDLIEEARHELEEQRSAAQSDEASTPRPRKAPAAPRAPEEPAASPIG
jgi:hypothetical protein